MVHSVSFITNEPPLGRRSQAGDTPSAATLRAQCIAGQVSRPITT